MSLLIGAGELDQIFTIGAMVIGVVALLIVLIIFAAATYAYLVRAARARTDQSLADTANAVLSNFAAEANDEEQSPADAAREVTRDLHFSHR